jgi:hypothetical protein
VLRDDALEPQLAGMLEYCRAVADDVIVELDAWTGDPSQEILEPAPSLLQRQRPNVNAAQLQEVEGVEERPVVVSLAVEHLEVRRAVTVADDRLSVEDQGALTKGCHGLPDEREPARPVVAPTGEQPHPVVLFPDDRAVPVVLASRGPTGGLSAWVAMHGLMKPGGRRLPTKERQNMTVRWQVGDG